MTSRSRKQIQADATVQASRMPVIVSYKWLRALLAVLSLCLLDIGAARLHYHYHLISMRADQSRALEEVKAGICPDGIVAIDFQDCEVVTCQYWARILGTQRQEVLELVRSYHPIGRVMAEGFDSARSKDQTVKLNQLLAEKQCQYVIEGSTRSNAAVDAGCFIAGIIGIAGLVASLNIPII